MLQRPVSVFDEEDEEEFDSFDGDSQWEVHIDKKKGGGYECGRIRWACTSITFCTYKCDSAYIVEKHCITWGLLLKRAYHLVCMYRSLSLHAAQ